MFKPKKMHKIYTLGESLLDIVFNEMQVSSAIPGGSMLNASISLGRLKLPVIYITDIAQDIVGDFLCSFLKTNDVELWNKQYVSENPSSIALAFLDKNRNAKYLFYKEKTKKITSSFPQIGQKDFLLFGSTYALDNAIFNKLSSYIKTAKKEESFIIYDPNIRKAASDMDMEFVSKVEAYFKLAHLIRISDDDMQRLYGIENEKDMIEKLQEFNAALKILTISSKKVVLISPEFILEQKVPKIIPISTVGAGDTFNASLIFEFYSRKISAAIISFLSKMEWKEVLQSCITFSQQVCMSEENYISKSFAANFL